MRVVIEIDDEEFGIDINDKFQDFFSRLKAEIKEHLMTNTSLVCGAYELETIDMFLEAFKNGTPLLKGRGRLIYADDIALIDEQFYIPSDYYVAESAINDAPTIIEGTEG